MEEIIKCPITAGTQNDWVKGVIISEKSDGSFIFNFTPVNIDSRKAFNRCFGPRYPDLAGSLMLQGITDIQFKITSQTNKPEIKIQKSSGFKELDDASVEHANNCLSYDDVKGDFEKDIWIDKKYNWKIKSEQ